LRETVAEGWDRPVDNDPPMHEAAAALASGGTIPPAQRVTALLLGAVLLGVWTWWPLSAGAFFGTVLLPGAILIYLALIVVIAFGRQRLSTRGPHVVALGAFAGIAVWTAVSMAWSPAQELALDYAQRAAVYAAAFGLGLAFATAVRQRVLISAVPLLVAGAMTVAYVLVSIWTADRITGLVDLDGTLDMPFEYRNANACFFVMVAVAVLPLMSRRRTGLVLRAALAALAASSLAIVAISQSRGSLLAVAAGLLAVVVASPNRGRALVATLLVFAPVAILFPQLLDAFDAAASPSALDELKQAATAAAAAGAIAAALSLAATAIEWQGRGIEVPRPPRAATWTAIGTLVLAGLLFLLLQAGNPVSSVGDRLDSLTSESNEDYGAVTGSRFTYSGGLNRVDFYEVALDQAADDPIGGGGAGSFRSRYLVDGNGKEAPRNAHSLPLEMLGELGAVGLLLVITAFTAAVWAAIRSRGRGRDPAVLGAVALAATAAVLAQAAVDWSWFFGALLAPPIALLGSAAAPAAQADEPLAGGVRAIAIAVLAILVVVATPTFISERQTLEVARSWRNDPDAATATLNTAADLNPVAVTPFLVQSEIYRRSGDPEAAYDAAKSAAERSPDDWRAYSLEAQALLAGRDPAEARDAAEHAARLNPHSREVEQLNDRLERGDRSAK